MPLLSAIKSDSNPLKKVARSINPTGIGVLVSIGAHIAFIAYGPRPNFSFAALSETAAQQEAEETIVPIVELTEAERSRLPSFAQPRPAPVTGIGSLPLPSGIPSISRPLVRRPTPAASLPSPTTRSRRIPSLGSTFSIPSRPRQPVGRVSPPPAVSVVPAPPVIPRSTTLPTVEAAPVPSTLVIPDSGPQDANQSNGSAEDFQPQPGVSIDEQLRALEAGEQPNEQPVAVAPEPTPIDPGNEEGDPTPIVIPEEPIDLSAAQGDPDQLRDAFAYDPTDVDQDSAQKNLDTWLEESADSVGIASDEIIRETTELTIDSNFKVCKEVPPARGLIGVIVNPDGTQESLQVLKSIGYDLLNRQAVDAVTYNDFGQPDVPTQYEVTIEVNYNADSCINELPQ